MIRTLIASLAVALLLSACSTQPPRSIAPPRASPPAAKPGYYQDDGPAEATPADLDAIPDASPRREPLHRFANRPYTVFGREYVPATSLRPYRERGVASWYGRKFHGQKTSGGETYDMFAMTAAHPTLPLPSFARVTNPANGKTVIVRVNDRGPFLHDRVIDLSYAAAHRLGIAQKGSGEVDVEAILFDDVLATAAPALPPVLTATAASALPDPSSAQPAIEPFAVEIRPPATMESVVAASATAAAGASSANVIPVAGAAETVPVATSPAGFVVQLGAFASNANARSFIGRLANQLPAAGVQPQVRQVTGLFRVFVGPYAAREDARRVAERLRVDLGLPSTIAVH